MYNRADFEVEICYDPTCEMINVNCGLWEMIYGGSWL